MIIRKCNECEKVIDGESYYSIDEVSYREPDSKTTRLSLDRSKNGIDSEVVKETKSWASWCSLDFCVKCFNKDWLARYVTDRD